MKMKSSKKDADLKSKCYYSTEAAIEWISMPGQLVHDMKWTVGRMRVPGGWLVTTIAMVVPMAPTTVFVADPEGSWDIGNEGSLRSKAEEELGLAQ